MNAIKVTDLDGNEYTDEISGVIKDVCRLVINEESTDKRHSVNVYLVSDDEIRKMNKEHRDIDAPTDVLSFPLDVYDPDEDAVLLGEIVISKDRAEEQARSLDHTLIREIAFLSLHAMLHLYGSDHEDSASEEAMIQKQKKYIDVIEKEIIIDRKKLVSVVSRTRKHLKNSYSPYSGFRVASAAVTKKGSVFFGVNIENASYGATICAERNAMFNAVSKGSRDIVMLVIVSDMKEHIYPCGICRQVMSELLSPWAKIVVTGPDKRYRIYRIDELLPEAFTIYQRSTN